MSARHHLIAWLVAAGRTNSEIARALGVNANRISTIRSSPLFQEIVKRAQVELRDRTFGGLVDRMYARLAAEADPTFDKLVQLRDQSDNLHVSFVSARELFNRIVPPRTEHYEERSVRISLDRVELREMAQAWHEATGGPPPIDVEALDAQVRAATIDEAVAEVQAQRNGDDE